MEPGSCVSFIIGYSLGVIIMRAEETVKHRSGRGTKPCQVVLARPAENIRGGRQASGGPRKHAQKSSSESQLRKAQALTMAGRGDHWNGCFTTRMG